ncbi:MAG: hypothetical protein RLO04_11205, partial [Limnobacter sp.]
MISPSLSPEQNFTGSLQSGDALHVLLCAAGFNLKWLMRAIALYLPLFAVMAWMKNIMQTVKNEQSSRFGLD